MYHRSLGDRVAAARDRLPQAPHAHRDRRRWPRDRPAGSIAYDELIARPRPAPAHRALRRRPPALVHGRHHRPAEGRALAPGHAARLRRSSPPTRCRARRPSDPRRPADRRRRALARSRHRRSVLAAHHPARARDRGAPGQHRVRGRRHHRAPRARPHRRRHHLRHHRARARRPCSTIVGDVLMRRIARALDDAEARGEPYDLSSLQRIHNSGAMVSAPLKDALLSRGTHARLRLARLERGRRLRRRAHHRDRAERDRALRARPATHACSPTTTATSCPGSGERRRARRRTRSCADRLLQGSRRAARPRSARSTARRTRCPATRPPLDADGTLTLLGRGSNCINSGGEKIWPEEVEEVLKEHPAVTDAVVLGVPDDEWGEIVAAVVATTGDRRRPTPTRSATGSARGSRATSGRVGSCSPTRSAAPPSASSTTTGRAPRSRAPTEAQLDQARCSRTRAGGARGVLLHEEVGAVTR